MADQPAPRVVSLPAGDMGHQRVSFRDVRDWKRVRFEDKVSLVRGTLELESGMSLFGWTSLGRQLLFGVPYLLLGDPVMVVDARLVTVVLDETPSPPIA